MNNMEYIDNHRVLLSLYNKSKKISKYDDASLIVESMKALGRKIADSSCDLSLVAYYRYANLIRLRLNSVGFFDKFECISLLSRLKSYAMLGISVVTCAMNRTENLLRVLPSWLQFDQIDEIVIVDWSSREAVRSCLVKNGFSDSRIKVVRVDGEPRWILSYAFNVGLRCSSFSSIMKIDADIVLKNDFFEQNGMPQHDSFIAGNYRVANEGQEHINGFLFATREALAKVGGYNEYISQYGWDDDDIYNRLISNGLSRIDVNPTSIYHIPHSDSARINNNNFNDGVVFRDLLQASPRFLIHYNRNICELMPAWNQSMPMLPMLIREEKANDIVLSRISKHHAIIPKSILEKACRVTFREILSQDCGGGVWSLTDVALDLLLDRQTSVLSEIDVELALSGHLQVLKSPGRYIVFALQSDLFDALSDFDLLIRDKVIDQLLLRAKQLKFNSLIYYSDAIVKKTIPSAFMGLACLSKKEIFDKLPEVSIHNFINGNVASDARISLSRQLFSQVALSAPMCSFHTRKFYIDAQHGLGNRLRAIASAAAIANAADMELVIVWEPDHHCDCKFSDLFEYDGPVIEQGFLLEACNRGMDVYNYMPKEKGAFKDVPIRLGGGCDIYSRSAYVLNNFLSTWSTENQFLKKLRLVKSVRQLVDSVPHSYGLSAHIRMEAGRGRDFNSYDSPDNWSKVDHELIHKWRDKSHYSHFMQRIDKWLSDNRGDKIFIAADMEEIYSKFCDRYGDLIVYLERNVYDRSVEQLRYALADAVLLGRSPLLLGSTWSSFTELAQRLSIVNQKIEMSGVDF